MKRNPLLTPPVCLKKRNNILRIMKIALDLLYTGRWMLVASADFYSNDFFFSFSS
mgnify:CR=1 FL=1